MVRKESVDTEIYAQSLQVRSNTGLVVSSLWKDDRSELMRNEDLSSWMMAKLKGSDYQARQEDDQRKSIVQQVVPKSTDFLRRIIAPIQEQEG